MTLSIDGTDIGRIIEIISWSATGIVIALMVVGLLILVRPPRHVRERRKAEKRGEIRTDTDPVEAEELMQLVERMETRLEVLERALADKTERPPIGARETERTLAPVADRDSGRKE